METKQTNKQTNKQTIATKLSCGPNFDDLFAISHYHLPGFISGSCLLKMSNERISGVLCFVTNFVQFN